MPSGASTGEQRRWSCATSRSDTGGSGVRKAVEHVNRLIGPKLRGRDARKQEEIDRFMLDLDGHAEQRSLGANAMLGGRSPSPRAAAAAAGEPLFRFLGGKDAVTLPCRSQHPERRRARRQLRRLQEFMVVPIGASASAKTLRMGTEVFIR